MKIIDNTNKKYHGPFPRTESSRTPWSNQVVDVKIVGMRKHFFFMRYYCKYESIDNESIYKRVRKRRAYIRKSMLLQNK